MWGVAMCSSIVVSTSTLGEWMSSHLDGVVLSHNCCTCQKTWVRYKYFNNFINNFQLYNEKYTQDGLPPFRINTNLIQKLTPYRILHRSMASIPTLSTWIANSWIWEEFFAQLPTMEGPWSMGSKGIAPEGTPCDSNGSCLDDATNAYV